MLSLIIPVRDWPQERIDTCSASFAELGSKSLTEIIIVDFGSKVPVRRPTTKLARVVRLEADLWSLSEANNAGVLLAKNPVIAKADADVVINPKSRKEFDRIATAVAAGEYGLVMGQVNDLPRGITSLEALEMVRKGTSPGGRLRPKWGQGALVFFSREAWDGIGGFDSRFTGWGNEDNDFAERMRQSGRRIGWADRRQLDFVHVWHPPTYAATGVLKQRERNQRIVKDDKSVLRGMRFRHSNIDKIAAPQVMRSVTPLVTLAVATSARPNRNRMTLEAINSFKGQIGNDVEVVIVDNGSPEKESRSLKAQLNKVTWPLAVRLEVVAEPSIPAARNLITSMSRGRYICVVDDDDLALPNRLEDHLKVFATDGNVHGSHGGWIDFDESSGVIERNQGKQRLISTLLKGTGKVTAHPASLYRADVLRAVPYDESYLLGSDWDLALRLANFGFEIRHTHSFITLRRFHAANVTITGQSNQVSNGLAARSRSEATFDWQRIPGLVEDAKLGNNNNDVYCRNQLSIETIAGMIPDYSGTWHIYVPIMALGITAMGLPVANARPNVMDDLLKLTSGELCTRRSGISAPAFFQSDGIVSLKKARALKQKIEELVGVPVQLNSVRQAEIDRETPFDWKSITVPPGERMLRSERFDDLTTLLNMLAKVGAGSLLRSAVSILSDFDDEGEAYYLVSSSIKGVDNLRQLEFDLERTLGVPFHHVTSMGVASELTPATRSH